jgi:hypothetical protein
MLRGKFSADMPGCHLRQYRGFYFYGPNYPRLVRSAVLP